MLIISWVCIGKYSKPFVYFIGFCSRYILLLFGNNRAFYDHLGLVEPLMYEMLASLKQIRLVYSCKLTRGVT